MCGIAGWLSSKQNLCEKPGLLDRMSQTLKERGPDEDGIYVERNTALIHRRLAVVDTENGKQPMIYADNAEKYVLVYNGELYNTDEIRTQLKAKGYEFESHSDTEVLLKAYVHWKENCTEKLNGIFAFAVYETKRKRLFLCRDRIGVKPLFYSYKDKEFIFVLELLLFHHFVK